MRSEKTPLNLPFVALMWTGILASMTVALSVQGCSLVELHAAMAMDVGQDKVHDSENQYLIEDVFYVVSHENGQPFADDQLEVLANALLKAAKTPMKVMSLKGDMNEEEQLEAQLLENNIPVPAEQITIIPRKAT